LKQIPRSNPPSLDAAVGIVALQYFAIFLKKTFQGGVKMLANFREK